LNRPRKRYVFKLKLWMGEKVANEKQMLDLKENIENEVHAAYDEYLKMEAHIKLYITEMEQAI
jgi:hypothetical protein